MADDATDEIEANPFMPSRLKIHGALDKTYQNLRDQQGDEHQDAVRKTREGVVRARRLLSSGADRRRLPFGDFFGGNQGEKE